MEALVVQAVAVQSYYSIKMYAVVKDNLIIDVGFGTKDSVNNLNNNINYTSDEYTLVEVTEKNSPMQLGQIYLGENNG